MFRLGARKILRYPGVSAITFLTLAIGIAVSATIFAVTWSTLVRPFPFRDQSRLVQFWVNDPKGSGSKLELSYDDFETMRKDSRTLESIAAYSAANFSVVGKRRDEPMQFSANLIDIAFFDTLGVRPALGRPFRTPTESSCILSDRAWRERFGADPNVLKESLLFAGSPPIAIVGVMPPHFDLPKGVEMVFPLAPVTDPAQRPNRVNTAIARMRPGVTLEQVAREAAVISAQIRVAHPERHEDVTIIPYPLVDEILGATKPALRIIFAMGMLVLVIALFNVASVALAQGVGRTSEIGVRGAVGATRWSCMLRFFLEASVLTFASAVAGFVLARVLLAVLLRIAPADTPRIADVSVGAATAVFAVAAAIVAALITAVAQAFWARQSEVMIALRASAKSTSHRGARRLLEALAAGQTAVAIVTLVVAALLVQSFRRYEAIDVGFSKDHILTLELPRGYIYGPDAAAGRNFYRTLHDRIRHISGVEASGSVLMRPLEVEQGWDFTFTAEGQSVDDQERNPLANLLSATPGYFDAMRTPLLRGRDFREDDGENSPKVAIVGESFARRFWGDPQNAIGKHVKSGKTDSQKPWVTVIGVVQDVRSRTLTIEKLDIYIPYTQTIWSPNFVAIRTAGSPQNILPAVRQIVAQLDKETPVSNVRTTAQIVDAKLAQPRLSAWIVVVFAATATFLAIIGFYGMLAYVVRERTPEMGVRMALGADAGGIRKLIVARAAIVALIGVIAGVVLSIATDRIWRGYVYGSEGIDAELLVAVAIGFELVAAMASLIPAARAASTNASAALRAE